MDQSPDSSFFTVAELIDALKQCPQDYLVMINSDGDFKFINAVGIDPNEKTVDLFA